MQLKQIAMLGVMGFFLGAQVAKADIIVRGSGLAGVDFCSTVNGHWAGDGKVVVSSLSTSCVYHAESDITGNDPTQLGMNIHTKRKSGSVLCPKEEDFSLTGQCVNNTLIIHTDDNVANFSGQFMDASTVELSGTIVMSGQTGSVQNMVMKKQ